VIRRVFLAQRKLEEKVGKNEKFCKKVKSEKIAKNRENLDEKME
jgi:hypothetical protein